MAKINEIPDFPAMWAQVKSDLLDIAETEGENFFAETFDKKGFTDVVFEPWQPNHAGTPILRNTGELWRSVQAFEKNEKRIVFGSDVEYAEYHNEGATIQVTRKMKKWMWWMYRQTGDTKYKYMALSKKTHFVIPKRQFIGESKTLLNNIENKFKRQLTGAFKNIKIKKL